VTVGNNFVLIFVMEEKYLLWKCTVTSFPEINLQSTLLIAPQQSLLQQILRRHLWRIKM